MILQHALKHLPAIIIGLSVTSDALRAVEPPFPGKQSDYRGYQRYDFVVDGCPTIVVAPKQTAPGKPWIWRAEFFDAFPQVDLALLDRGFHLAYIRVGNTFGCPDALAHWDVLYRELTERYGLSRKPVLEGLSRGGLYCFNWAADHPDQVGCILADNAVLDFKSWPGGKGRGKGSPNDWKKLLSDYHFASEAEALAYAKNPVDNLESLAKAQVPLFLLCADADDVVPYPENGAIVHERYERLAGPVRLLIKKGLGHHPHGLDDPTPVVNYILEHTGAAASVSADEPTLVFHDPHPQRYELTARASEIDPRTRPHPEIDFVFEKQGKPGDVEHAVVDTRTAPRGKLVIWLMAYNPLLFERLSGYGLHAIQVHYANGWFGKLSPMAPPSDDQYLGKIRLEAATGEDFSDAVNIPRPDGMMERAFQLVNWLARENPQGAWEQFLTDDKQGLRWDRVIMAGSSHGSTTAARFAIHRRVDRVVMFCGPRDQLETWQGLPSATPANRFFGFSHVLDGGWTGDHYSRSWELLGLHQYGPIVNVDQARPPYGNTRRLITDADVKQDAQRAHSSVVPGGAAVKDSSGRFIHEAVWRYLFTQPVDVTGEPVAPDLIR